MSCQLLHKLFSDPTDFDFQEIYDHESILFWVDWREDDVDIPRYCESILMTGRLSSNYSVEDNNTSKLFITYDGEKHEVPLTMSHEDRHITLFTLNEILKPDFEIRLLIESAGDCTLGFLPLKKEDWRKFEEQYGEAVNACFGKIEKSPNLFTQGYGYMPSLTWQELAREKCDKLGAIKLYKEQNNCGLLEAKQTVEKFIESCLKE